MLPGITYPGLGRESDFHRVAVRAGAARDGLDTTWIVQALPGWLAEVAANLD